MALVQGELVHHQAAYLAWLKNADRSFHAPLVERLEGVPMQASQAADVADQQQLQQTLKPNPQGSG